MKNQNAEELKNNIRAQAEVIAKRGKDVRAAIAKLAAESAAKLSQETKGLREVARAVVEGASEGVQNALPERGESVLREVVSGLSEGLSRSAETVKEALEETGEATARFAREDLERLAGEMKALDERFVDVVAEAASKTRKHAAAQAKALRDHATRTFAHAKPAFEAAIAAARRDPKGLGKETFAAGSAATKQAAGALFTEIGKRLEKLGERLNERDD